MSTQISTPSSTLPSQLLSTESQTSAPPGWAAAALGYTQGRKATMKRDALIWIGGALVVVLGVAIWLLLTAPQGNSLAESYRFGVL